MRRMLRQRAGVPSTMLAPAMMSSVIPARLEFQCGHAALVSLPRVKGESSAQRTDRIAREKSAAQARSCDFCPPPLTVVETAQAVVVVAVEPAPPVALPVPPVVLPVRAVSLPVRAVSLPVRPVSLPVRPVSLPVPPVGLPAPPVALPVAPAAAQHAAPVGLPVPTVASRPDAPTTAVKRVGRPRQKSAPAAQPAPRNGRATTTYRFLVRYRTETVVEAIDIRDALRQVELLGATEVLALTRKA
jgi:hypothetical protein